jgi:sugar phosphate isomerase/epimerase
VKFVYAFRRSVHYPYVGDNWNLPGREVRGQWLKKVRSLGFDGLELSNAAAGGPNATPEQIRELRRELEDNGLPCLCVRGGGGLANPRTSNSNRKKLEEAIRFAGQIGSPVMNTTVGTPVVTTLPGNLTGEPTSQGSSRDAHQSDYEVTAAAFRELSKIAADEGVEISIEVHQHSIADNSWSALHLLNLIDRPNVGINPDLGNILWVYDVPEESSEQAIVALAPHAKYWHCKNLRRVHIPENKHTIFLRVPLPDGEIDYRFAMSAMVAAGYQGNMAIEGMQLGDQLTGDGRSVAYAREILAELE